ncbi:uncharacterized protein UDID_17364 [Ustilago sp. UG-2017a]|nr:uncharacterized protein UDID_17364 [Ustilago sp. UG-2017a]
MAGEGDHQAGETTKKTKGGRKGKVVQQVQIDDEATDGNETEFNEAEEGSDSDDDNEHWSTLIKATLRVVPHTIQHLEGTYDNNHPKWNRNFEDALAGVLRSTLDAEGEHNILSLLLDISKAYLTFHQTWKKIENGLTSEATRTSLSAVARLKSGIGSCINTITYSVELCDIACGIAILHEICSRAVSITFLARICSWVNAIADFD